jgi:hypothetical protein
MMAWKRRIHLHIGPQKIAHLNRLGKIVYFIALFPINPDVFDTDVTAIVGLPHQPQDAGVVNRVVRKGALQTSLACAARMKVGCVGDQRFAGAVGQADAREMRDNSFS